MGSLPHVREPIALGARLFTRLGLSVSGMVEWELHHPLRYALFDVDKQFTGSDRARDSLEIGTGVYRW